jgi:hypothetical protein
LGDVLSGELEIIENFSREREKIALKKLTLKREFEREKE